MSQGFYPKELDRTVEETFGRNVPAVPDSFGLEIEAEGVPPDGLDWLRYLPGVWQTHADNSLRDGIEFVSNGGRPLTELPGDLDALHNTFAVLGYTPVFGYRTSLHVHMNVNDLSIKEVMNLFTLYTIFETPIVDFGGEERRGNVHCLSVHDTAGVIEIVRGYLRGTNTMTTLINRERRYAAFNWASLALHGTIEFRSHRGTADRDTIMAWVQLLADLKDAARRFRDPQDVVRAFSELTPQGFAADVFRNSQGFRDLLGTYDKALWEGVRVAQEVAFGRSSWDAPKGAAKGKKSGLGGDIDPGIVTGRAGRRRGPVQRGENQWDVNWLAGQIRVNPVQEPLQARVFDDWGFDQNGFDREGFDREGFDVHGFDPNGENRFGETVDEVQARMDREFEELDND